VKKTVDTKLVHYSAENRERLQFKLYVLGEPVCIAKDICCVVHYLDESRVRVYGACGEIEFNVKGLDFKVLIGG